MSLSYFEFHNVDCQSCPTTFRARIWQIVHADENPELDRLAAVGDLHRLECPRCGHRTLVQTPLLLVRPGAARPLTLRVGRTAKEREIEAMARDLVERLRDRAERLLDGSWFQRSAARMKGLGRKGRPIWEESWVEDLQIVIDPSVDELDTEAEAEEEDSVEERPLMEQTFIALATAGSLEQKKRFIQEHPILLNPEIDEVVARMRDNASAEGSRDSAELLEVYRVVLFACREYGIERAFSEIQRSADSPDRQVTSYCDAASQLINRFEASGDLSHLDMALIVIEKAQKLIAETVVQMDLHTRVLNEGARLLLWRSSCTGSTPDLDRAISMLNEALLNAGTNSRKRGLYLGNLGSAYGSRYKLTGDPGDLDRAVSLHRDSLREELDGPPRRASALSSLGLGLNMRYALTSRLEDLEEAVHVSRQAAALAPADSLEGIAVLARLATILLARYQRLREAESLEEAVDLAERAAAATPEDSPDYLRNLGILSTAKLERYTLREDLGDLERSIELGRTIIRRSSVGSPDVPSVCRDLCQALQSRHARLGDPADLDRAVEFGEQAVAQTPVANPDRVLSLAGLADSIGTRYQRTGNLADLNRSLELYRAAMELFSIKTPSYFNVCSNYGTALLDHHQSSGSMESLQELVDVMRRVIRHTPPAMVGAETYQLNLAVGLVKRGETLHASRDLREAVEICVAILAHDRVTPSVRMTTLYTLCGARLALVIDNGDLQTLNLAIDDARRAIASGLSTQPSRIPWLSLLASCLSERFSLSRNPEDLNEAITLQESALSSAEEWGAQIEPQRVNLADSLLSRFESSRRPADVQKALLQYRLVCTGGAQQPEYVVMASRAWANWCLKQGHWQDAVEAAAFGLRAAERLHDTQPSLSGKTAWLGALGGLYLGATCALARTGDLTGAVATMERGRAKLLSDSLDLRQGAIDAVRTTQPELVQALERALEQLQQTEQVESKPWWDFNRCEQLRAVRRNAHEELASLIREIRTLPGHDRFLEPPDFREIARSLENGIPVVYLAPSVGGTVALFVRRVGTRLQVKASWADALTQQTLHALVVGSEKALNEKG